MGTDEAVRRVVLQAPEDGKSRCDENARMILEHMRRTVSGVASLFAGPFVRFVVFDLQEPKFSEQSQNRECDGR